MTESMVEQPHRRTQPRHPPPPPGAAHSLHDDVLEHPPSRGWRLIGGLVQALLVVLAVMVAVVLS